MDNKMNTFEEYTEKFINMTNNNELVWKEMTGFSHESRCSYRCNYKNTSIVLKHFSNCGTVFNTPSINGAERTEKQGISSNLYYLCCAITIQIKNRETEKMLKILNELEEKE